jgi:hypothetical protein
MAELVKKLGIKRESGWVYFVDADGDVSRGRVGAIVGFNPTRYAKPVKVMIVGIAREEGFLYRVSEDGDIVRESQSK